MTRPFTSVRWAGRRLLLPTLEKAIWPTARRLARCLRTAAL